LNIDDQLYEYDISFRNLIVSLYIELEMKFEGDSRTITGIYNKAQRWIKVKGVIPPIYQKKEGSTFGRKNKINSFSEILDFFVEAVVDNVKLKQK